ncbi:D-glycerate dehydrogenase [Bacillus sp. ISL-47]|uniref:2-hydroxyacid dehydrogenase n=1 Tax=Bacillus sp. ISL-47 TaxID=2819130 RepID=UPI001BEB20B1|nr:D-glycerate dehydrogenase [Bacillus sp. ISL-47]MBT2687564.1 D-glycerate dehydrogenase [Bacillus sp. ISL-47]MBT2706439.1 D-glycerate dehydrogenase [Pseudomonas sp. ISL-84]
MKPYIFISRMLPDDAVAILKEKYDVHMWNQEDVPVPYEIFLEEAKKADALLTMLSEPVNEEVLHAGERLKIVANMAVGYDNVDVEAASRLGITVTNTPDVLNDSTADLTFALVLAAARRMVEAAEFVKEGNWKSWSPLLLAGQDVHHKTIGIVGMGNIGETVAKRATGFEMEILYHNRSRKPDAEQELGAQYVSFDELLERSDFVVCLTPLTDGTRNLFNRDAFKKMKKHAVFVNASRGPVVNEQDLFKALLEGEIAAAGLDVFAEEPIGSNHPLLELKNVVAMPHIGSASTETRYAMMKLCMDNIDLVLSGNPPKTPVNKK